MTKYNLTPRQKDIYEFIKRYITANKKSPYIREIQDGCDIHCYKSAVDKLLALEKKGMIKRKLNKHRGIILGKDTYKVPVEISQVKLPFGAIT